MSESVKVAADAMGFPDMPDDVAAVVAEMAEAKAIPILLILEMIKVLWDWWRNRKVAAGVEVAAFDLTKIWAFVVCAAPCVSKLLEPTPAPNPGPPPNP